MGDHRVSISIKMTGHGITRELNDAYWNWSVPGSYHDMVDDRAIEFMATAWEEMRAKYDKEMYEAERKNRERKEAEEERREYERLKAKFENGRD